jgi:hypothetical protein
MDTTTLVPAGWLARRLGTGAMVLERAQTVERDVR